MNLSDMNEWEIFVTEGFDEELKKMDTHVKEWYEKVRLQLKENPYSGKPLGFRWFREKKLEGWRIYYLISQQHQRVLLVTIGDKKDQSHAIAEIRANREHYFSLLN